MPTQTKEWRIHIGAHKTATTHLQELLEARRASLSDAGVNHPDAGRIKRMGSALSERKLWWKNLRPVRLLRAKRIVRLIDSESTLPVTLVSSERLIGSIEGLFAERYYPEAAERLADLMSAIGQGKGTILLSLRSHASLLPSAYCQCLRTGLWKIPPLDELEARALSHMSTWTDLIHRLQQACPKARIIAWRFEDYLRDPRRFLDMATGTRIADSWPTLDAPRSTRRLSWEAVRQLLALDPGMGADERIEQGRRIAENDSGKTPFRPFSPSADKALEDLYERDIETLRGDFPGLLFE